MLACAKVKPTVRPPKYPLELVVDVRKRRVDEASRDLAKAARGREAAENRRVVTQKRNDAHGAAAERVRCAEEDALVRGKLSVADLSRAGSWEARVAQERGALAGELSKALANEAGARAEERQAQEKLESRMGESQLAVNHRARWREGLQRRTEANEEEAASEAWRCRTSKPRS
jgi:hypothetical protein